MSHRIYFFEETPMVIEVLRHTPTWVYILFVALLILGYLQSKDRTSNRLKVLILPIVMSAFSFHSLQTAFGSELSVMLSAVVGLLIAFSLVRRSGQPKGVNYLAESQQFSIPGSWVPLVLIMAIFFTKYFVGITIGMKLPLGQMPLFIHGVCFGYGVFSLCFDYRL